MTAVGISGVRFALDYALGEMGVTRTAATLRKMNQVTGFDCPGCAWPDPAPGDRSHAEFCENGAKAAAAEATRERIGPEFFARHSVAQLRELSDRVLERSGRLTEPMYLAPGGRTLPGHCVGGGDTTRGSTPPGDVAPAGGFLHQRPRQ